MCKLTDFHTHILPGIDDGAETVEESIEMIQTLYRQGVRRVLLTPHFYPQAFSLQEFLSQRDTAIKQLLSRSDLPKDMEIISAAEVYLHEAILNYSTQEISQLCIPGTNLILAELPYNTDLTPSVLQRVYALIYNNNCTPVMAHIDRYLNRLKYKQIVELLDEGCRLQINLGHLERMPLVRKLRLRRLIRAGQVECCGSDCHNLSSRPPHFADPAKYLKKIAGSTIADEILTAKKLLP